MYEIVENEVLTQTWGGRIHQASSFGLLSHMEYPENESRKSFVDKCYIDSLLLPRWMSGDWVGEEHGLKSEPLGYPEPQL